MIVAKILIVDDEKDICEIVGEYVREISAGAEIVLKHDGLDGFMESGQTDFDLIITDMKMPFLNGKDMILAIRTKSAKNIDTPIIMLSGFLNKETISKLEGNGIFCLNKPIDHPELQKLIQNCLNS